MPTRTAKKSTAYAQAIAELVANMPAQRAAQVFDFARFLQSQAERTPPPGDSDDWLNDSEEQMQEEDALWDATIARHRDKFTSMAEAARAEIEAGTTQPMFNEREEFKLQ